MPKGPGRLHASFHRQALLAFWQKALHWVRASGASNASWEARQTLLWRLPRIFCKPKTDQEGRLGDSSELLILGIPQFQLKTKALLWGWTPDPFSFNLDRLLFRHGMSKRATISVPLRLSSLCLARFPVEHTRTPLSETTTNRELVGGHVDSLQHVWFFSKLSRILC